MYENPEDHKFRTRKIWKEDVDAAGRERKIQINVNKTCQQEKIK